VQFLVACLAFAVGLQSIGHTLRRETILGSTRELLLQRRSFTAISHTLPDEAGLSGSRQLLLSRLGHAGVVGSKCRHGYDHGAEESYEFLHDEALQWFD